MDLQVLSEEQLSVVDGGRVSVRVVCEWDAKYGEVACGYEIHFTWW